MRNLAVALLLSCLILGCHAPETSESPYVNVVTNLGMEHGGDLHRLYEVLTSSRVPCRMRAMSLGMEQIVVKRTDFERARGLVTENIIHENLSVRVYKSPDFAESPTTSLLEVWRNGEKVREEQYIPFLLEPGE